MASWGWVNELTRRAAGGSGRRKIAAETRDNAAIVHDLDGTFNVHNLDRVAATVSENFELVDFALPTARSFASQNALANGIEAS